MDWPWPDLSRANTSSLGWWRDRVFVPYLLGTATRFHPAYPGYGESVRVMEEDWDNLVVLDACRADAFEATVDVDQFDAYQRAVSLGSHSSEWTRKNFSGGSFGDTVYVSANPHTSLIADTTFHELVEIWKDYECSPNMIDPRDVVDAAMAAHREHPDKRLIVHFMQPHGTGGLVEEGDEREATYRRTIEAVVPIVTDMHERLGGKSVFTADHGELFNSGLKAWLGLDQHKARLRFPGLVAVPWATMDGARREIDAGRVTTVDRDEELISQRLRDLGYHS